jgi:hypothetical protein
MPRNFYSNKEYREKQSAIMKENWKKGIFNVIIKRDKRKCAREKCNNIFEVKQSDPKIYCCRSCSGRVNNLGRIHSEETKFCSNKCAMAVIGGKPTSPKAARGKAGIRKDVSNEIYFYF